jgi:hypothetical protein
MKNLKPISQRKLNRQFHKKDVAEQIYKLGKYKKEKIQNYVNNLSKELEEKGFKGSISVSLLFDFGWRSGYFTPVGQNPSLFSLADSDFNDNQESEILQFAVYLIKDYTRPTFGGCNGKYNDCLYYSLLQALGQTRLSKYLIGTPLKLKKLLGVQRFDTIDIKYIPKLESILRGRYKINVFGDHKYTSTLGKLPEINIELRDGHYTLEKKTTTWMIYSKDERKPYIYETNNKDRQITIFDGVKYFKIGSDDFHNEYKFKSECVFIPLDLKSDKNLEDAYKNFVRDADLLKIESKGIINLYKTGGNYETALYLFNYFCKGIDPDEIKQDEAEFLLNATFGALMFSKKYKGPGYKYDVCSLYPSLMKSNKLMIPIKRGEFVNLIELEQILKVGIYRCIIKPNSSDDYKLFRFNNKNYYTHTDIYNARKLKLNIELIIDDKPNALIYTRDKCLNCNIIFERYVEILFELKQKGIKRAKAILNILWGALCKKRTRIHIDSENNSGDISIDEDIKYIYPLPDNKTFIKTIYFNKMYQFNFARLGPFLLAKGRATISEIMKPNIDKIQWIHTDGFISCEPLTYKLGKNLGNLKLEAETQECEIINCTKVLGFLK